MERDKEKNKDEVNKTNEPENLEDVNEETFNAITVDGDTSTSDTVIISATGMAENKVIKSRQDWIHNLTLE